MNIPTGPPVVAVDFDGTIVQHVYPGIGPVNPGAFETLKWLSSLNVHLIFWTCRVGVELDAAVSFCQRNGLSFWSVNRHPGIGWPKAYADLYIDDRGLGIP